jgi:hypothetical protein
MLRIALIFIDTLSTPLSTPIDTQTYVLVSMGVGQGDDVFGAIDTLSGVRYLW